MASDSGFLGPRDADSKGPDGYLLDCALPALNRFLEYLFILLDSGNAALAEIYLYEAGKALALQLVHQIEDVVPFVNRTHTLVHHIQAVPLFDFLCRLSAAETKAADGRKHPSASRSSVNVYSFPKREATLFPAAPIARFPWQML